LSSAAYGPGNSLRCDFEILDFVNLRNFAAAGELAAGCADFYAALDTLSGIGIGLLIYERKLLGVLDGFDFEIHVKIRPIQMMFGRQLHVENLADGCRLEPRVLFKGQKIFAFLHKQPEAVGGDVRHFNGGNVFAMPGQFHRGAP
jgi:hypothetical protein